MSGVPGPGGEESVRACGGCLRRAELLRILGPFLQTRGRRRPGELLALGDEELIAAVAGRHRARIVAELERFDHRGALVRCGRVRVEPICRHCPEYPPALLDAADAPALIHLAGEAARFAELTAQPCVAVVGARRASPYGLAVARALGRGLAAAGVTVVSGMALGIDSASHRGALESGGSTIAVLAGGAERAYPRSEARLHARLRAEACVISEMPPGVGARAWAFPARNRIIAALARMTVVVEAAERSGSLITATIAGDLGRDVGAVPGQVTAPLAAGVNALLADGAVLVRDAGDVLDALYGAGAGLARPSGPGADALAPPLRALLELIAAGHDTLAALVAAAGEGVDEVLSRLAELELRGRVSRAAGGRYVVMPS